MKKRQKNKKKKKKPKRKTKGRKTKGKKQTRKKSKVGYGEDPKYIEENKVNFTVKELTFYLDLLEKGNPTSLRGTKIINFYLKNKDSFKNVKDSNGKSFPFRSV